jgi:hypothetical protein
VREVGWVECGGKGCEALAGTMRWQAKGGGEEEGGGEVDEEGGVGGEGGRGRVKKGGGKLSGVVLLVGLGGGI